MTKHRHTASTINDDALDELYDNANQGWRRGDRWKERALKAEASADSLASVRPQTLANVATHLDARAVAILRLDSKTYEEWQVVVAFMRRMAAEAPTTTKPDTETLAAMFEGLAILLATSSRDWGQYRVDAWLWAVLVGWDCEQDEHDETCVHGAMEEMQQRHGWSDEAVAKARRYRAAVRALTTPTAEENSAP